MKPHTTLVVGRSRDSQANCLRCGDAGGLNPDRNGMFQKIEISQNDKSLMRTIAGVAPPVAIIRVEKIRHQPIRVVIEFIRFENAGTLEFGKTFQFIA